MILIKFRVKEKKIRNRWNRLVGSASRSSFPAEEGFDIGKIESLKIRWERVSQAREREKRGGVEKLNHIV